MYFYSYSIPYLKAKLAEATSQLKQCSYGKRGHKNSQIMDQIEGEGDRLTVEIARN